MKYYILMLVSLLCFFSLHAENILIDGLLYQVNESDQTADVVGNELASDTLIDLVIPSTIASNGKEYTVRRVMCPGLSGCQTIKSVKLPSCLQRIEQTAFKGCSYLRKLTIQDADSLVVEQWAFDNCNLQTIVVSGNVFCSYWEPIDRMFLSSLKASQVIITGDMPKSGYLSGYLEPQQYLIIQDNVNDISGYTKPYYRHIYSYSKTPPALNPRVTQGEFDNTTVHVTRESYAAYFQDSVWSRYVNLTNDAVPTKSLSLATHDIQLHVDEQVVLSIDKDGTQPTIVFNSVNSYEASKVGLSKKSETEWSIRGKKPGEVTLVFACGELEDTCHVTVLEALVPTPIVTLSPETLKLEIEETAYVNHTITDGPEQELSYNIGNPEIAAIRTVGNKCQVLALRPGTTVLTAATTQGDCIPGECQVRVRHPADLNKDWAVNITDVNFIINRLLGKNNPTPPSLGTINYDVNRDDKVDIADVNAVINAMLGKQ